jgi:CubicO group peptidase (beta-lactamase class C family)
MQKNLVKSHTNSRIPVIMSVKPLLNCLKCRLVVLFLLFFQSLQPLAAQGDFTGVETLIKQNQKNWGKNLVMLVNKADKQLYKYETLEFKVKATAPIGLASSWLTAAVVMVYVDEGKISLDDPVAKYLPIFEKHLKGYITIRQCLANTTGIGFEADNPLKLVQRKSFPTLEEEVNAYASKREIRDNAGQAYGYNYMGLHIAARVVEVVSKKSFDRAAAEKLFRTAGMRATTFYADKGAIDPSAGAVSTANDYMNFLLMLLNKGTLNGRKVLSEASVAELAKSHYAADLPVRSNNPPAGEGYRWAPGAWIAAADASGNATVMNSDGLSGTYAWVDFARGYAALLFPAAQKDGQKRDAFLLLKDEVEDIVK